MISAIYLLRHQESLAAHRQGHPATAVHIAMEFSSWIERRVGNERGHDTPAQTLKPTAGQSHRPGRVEPLRSLHIPWYLQAKLLAAKGQIHPSHCSGTHTTTEMLKHSLVPHTGGSCQVSHQRVPLQIRYQKDFSASQRAETWQSVPQADAASKATSEGIDKPAWQLSFGKVLRSLAQKDVTCLTLERVFYTQVEKIEMCILTICMHLNKKENS